MTTHTPGPWEARPVPAMRAIVIAEAGTMYPHAHVTTPTAEPQPITEAEYANARLIATAPKLLAALEWIVEFIDEHPEWDDAYFRERGEAGPESEWFDSAKAIIAEAKGE